MDIEEDIKILEKFKNNEMQRDKLERDSRCGGWKIGDIYKKIELNIAINHILAEREEDKKKIEELEDENRIQRHQIMTVYDNGYIHKDKIKDDYITKQKVKDILLKYKYVSINDTKGIVQFYQEFKKLVEDK